MRSATPERRRLPSYAAGAVEVPYVIGEFAELVEQDTVWEVHSHPTHELLWNESGASTATVGPRTWTITPSVGLWMPAGAQHSAAAPAGTFYCAAHFDVATAPAISIEPVVVEITPLLRLLLLRLHEPDLAAASRSVTEAMIMDVLAPSSHELSVHVPELPLLRPVVDAVLHNPGDRRTLEDWANSLGVSSRTLTRAFRSETGQGFARWIASVRAQRAIGLLAAGQALDEVAAAVGYATVSAFGAAFRRTTGVTPSAFR